MDPNARLNTLNTSEWGHLSKSLRPPEKQVGTTPTGIFWDNARKCQSSPNVRTSPREVPKEYLLEAEEDADESSEGSFWSGAASWTGYLRPSSWVRNLIPNTVKEVILSRPSTATPLEETDEEVSLEEGWFVLNREGNVLGESRLDIGPDVTDVRESTLAGLSPQIKRFRDSVEESLLPFIRPEDGIDSSDSEEGYSQQEDGEALKAILERRYVKHPQDCGLIIKGLFNKQYETQWSLLLALLKNAHAVFPQVHMQMEAVLDKQLLNYFGKQEVIYDRFELVVNALFDDKYTGFTKELATIIQVMNLIYEGGWTRLVLCFTARINELLATENVAKLGEAFRERAFAVLKMLGEENLWIAEDLDKLYAAILGSLIAQIRLSPSRGLDQRQLESLLRCYEAWGQGNDSSKWANHFTTLMQTTISELRKQSPSLYIKTLIDIYRVIDAIKGSFEYPLKNTWKAIATEASRDDQLCKCIRDLGAEEQVFFRSYL